MANTSAISGLAPVRYLNGTPWTGAVNFYCILAADTNEYWVGDLVTTIGNAGGDAAGVPSVTLASAGAAARGVIVGIGTNAAGGPYVNPNNLSVVNRPAGAQSVNYYVAVVDDPNVLFEIQEGGVHAALTTSSVSRNVNINTGTRTDPLYVSPTYMDNNTVNTTSTLNLKIMSLIQRVDNAFGASSKWLVLINNHEFRTGTTSP